MLLVLLLLSSLLWGEHQLYQSPYWQTLLHFKNGESQIDDPLFFLSKEGKASAQKELEATLKALENDNPKDINSTQCQYPARTRWLKEHLPNTPIKECLHLDSNLKKFDFKTLYLVYTSSFMNAPASMVGHTFLRFDKDEHTPLLSYALNYSARIDKGTDILSYAYGGLFGKFEGRYGVVPYYEMVKQYADMEHRDMWEYKLNLTKEEIERVVLHMFEIQKFYSNYFFTSKNCSYNLLWFIELAKEENLNLMNEFNYITTPLDTIKSLQRHHLIKESSFRPSKTTKVKSIYQQIEQKVRARAFLQSANLSLIHNLPTEQQMDILSLYFLKSDDENISHILKYRSQLGIKKPLDIHPTTNPIKSNLSTKLSIGYRDNSPTLGIRLAYHDIYDVDYAFNKGDYISFFDIKATPKKLESFKLIEIDSLGTYHPLYNNLSWGLSFGMERDSHEILSPKFKLKGGESFDIFFARLSIAPSLDIAYNNQKFEPSLGYDIKLLKSIRDVKLGLLATQEQKELFLTYQLFDDMALHLSFEERFSSFRIFFYF